MNIFSKLFRKSPQVRPEVEKEFVVDLARVVPRVKAVFGGDTPDPHPRPNPDSEHLQMSAEDSPVFETFATGLAIFYAMDMGDSYLLLQNRHLTDGITQEKLHAAALANMAREVADRTELQGDPDQVLMVTNGGNFEAAMLVVEGFCERVKAILRDDICVAVPARDLLFIAGRNNREGRERLRALVRKFFDEQETAGLLVRHIYGKEGAEWVVLETA